MIPELEWRVTRGDEGWQQAFSGEMMVGQIDSSFRSRGCGWTMVVQTTSPGDRCFTQGASTLRGEAETVAKAKAAVAAEWRAWLRRAGITDEPEAPTSPGPDRRGKDEGGAR